MSIVPRNPLQWGLAIVSVLAAAFMAILGPAIAMNDGHVGGDAPAVRSLRAVETAGPKGVGRSLLATLSIAGRAPWSVQSYAFWARDGRFRVHAAQETLSHKAGGDVTAVVKVTIPPGLPNGPVSIGVQGVDINDLFRPQYTRTGWTGPVRMSRGGTSTLG